MHTAKSSKNSRGTVACDNTTMHLLQANDLLKNSMMALGAKLQEVLILSLQDGVFHASLLVQTIDKEILSIDARSSDAIALAVRFGAPIFVYEEVIEEAGLLSEIFLPNLKKGSLAEYNIAELEALLERVLEKEDFESAARIRDLIVRRKGGDFGDFFGEHGLDGLGTDFFACGVGMWRIVSTKVHLKTKF